MIWSCVCLADKLVLRLELVLRSSSYTVAHCFAGELDSCECSVCLDVDLYFAPFDNVFVVNVDSETGVHNVSIDPIYLYKTPNSDTSTFQSRVRRHLHNNTSNQDTGNSTDDSPPGDKVAVSQRINGFLNDPIIMALVITSLKYKNYLTLQCVTCSLRFSLLNTPCIHCCHPREDVVIDTDQRVMITSFQTVHVIFINSLMF